MVGAINDHDIDAQVAHFHPDYDSVQPSHPSENFMGRDQVHKNWSTLMETVPDLRVDIERWAVNGPEAWTELHVHGRRLNGAPLDIRGVIITTVDDGLIVSGRIFLEEVERDGPTIDDAVTGWATGQESPDDPA
jgi:hypothetical protein